MEVNIGTGLRKGRDDEKTINQRYEDDPRAFAVQHLGALHAVVPMKADEVEVRGVQSARRRGEATPTRTPLFSVLPPLQRSQHRSLPVTSGGPTS